MLFSTWLRSWKTNLARSPRGSVRRRHQKAFPSRFRPGVESLEDRTLLSTAVISGPSIATDTAFGRDTPPYTLHLIASEPATQWTINWGDGSDPDRDGVVGQTIIGNPSEVTHAYTTGQVVRNISATALINGQTVVATTSGEGKDLGAFGNLPGHYGTVFGPDMTGDQYSDLYTMQWDYNTQTGSLQAYDGRTGAFLDTLSSEAGFWLTLGPDNDLYFARSGTGYNCVYRYDFATQSTTTFVSPGSGGLDHPFGLAFGHDANDDGIPDLYVASAYTNQILRYDGANGQFLGALVSNVSGNLESLAFGPDGDLYMTTRSGDAVRRYDFATSAITTFVGAGSGGLYAPGHFTFGPDGDLYVVSELNTQTASYGNWRVLHYDGTTGAYLSTISSGWGSTTRAGDNMNSVAFGPDNNLYTSWSDYPLMPSGTVATTTIQCFAGPFAAGSGTQLPVTVLKTYQKIYTNTRSLAIPDGTSTWSGTPGKTATSTINVADAGTIVDVNVKFSLTHPNDGDLQAWLTSPNGARADLFNRVGGSGDNFTNTVLDDEAPSGIFVDNATAPFTDTFRPEGWLGNLDGGPSNGTWAFSLCDYVKGNKGSLNNWSITVTYGIGPAALSAPSEVADSTAPAVSESQVQPLVQEAANRWQSAGLTPQQAALLRGVDVQIADLGGATLGLTSGNTIVIDDNAAGWGWFVDPTPCDDSEFTTPGDQGEQGKIDLLTVLTHEMGHLLGLEHSAASGDVMSATLNSGVRLMPTAGDLPGSTLAGFSPSHSDDAGKAQPHLRTLPASCHALDATDALFAELARRTQGA